MKCIHCENDCKYSERTDGRCPKCRKAFAFEPQTGSKVTDMAFKHAIDVVSANGTVRFLPEHVRYELQRRKVRDHGASKVSFSLSAGAAVVGIAAGGLPAGVCAVIFGLFGLMVWPRKHLRADSFYGLWDTWCATHGVPANVIVKKETKALEPYRGQAEMEQYSFDRAVICDRPETVDLLLANNFHFENNCAVLAVGGYPPRAFDTVKAMLRQNPKLTVYVLHDATTEGCALAHKLASSPEWFKDRSRVVEVGIRPSHSERLRGLWSEGTDASETPGISAEERSWLRQHSAELFAIRPEQVIKRLFKAITTDVGVLAKNADVWTDKTSLVVETATSDGGDDAFG